jgi:hypothetical protein
MPYSRSTPEQMRAEERPLMLLLAQVEATMDDLERVSEDSPWTPCLARIAASLRRGLRL